MKATETNFLKFLEGKHQFIIPIYQRTYCWTLKQCQQLWNDIVRTGSDEKASGHFIGSVVYIDRGLYHVTSVPQLLVIDGQQRLTTLSLLLAAFGKALEETEAKLETSRRKIESYYLFNKEEEGEEQYKLLLTQSDKDTFIRQIEDCELPATVSPRIKENYQFFENQIRKQEIDLNILYNGIKKLIIVDISLDRYRDDPQLIFESLNSTGLDLSQADMIRNYVLMGLEPKEQEQIYNSYWFPMEQSFDKNASTEQFDRFIRDYLTLKSPVGSIPNIRDVYRSFKVYVQAKKGTSIKDIVEDVYCYSKYFVKMAFEQEADLEIKQVLADINTLKVDVAYPFLLEVYDDYAQNILKREEFISILRMVEAYVFRRAVCGIPTNSMNKNFATISREIDRENYLESLQIALIRKGAYQRFPDDEEFRREFVVKDIYKFRNRNYLFRKLENYQRKELVNIEEYTVEHIIPQNLKLSLEWQADLGEDWKEIQAKYLHTIGNLTLTGYNPELSDRPFIEKRDMQNGGFADSPLRLNQGLRNLKHWNEIEINKRAVLLANNAVKIWSFPAVNLETENLKVNQILRSHHAETLQGETLKLFEVIRLRILNLDASVREDFKKHYIAYKITTNFVDIVPQKSGLRLSLNLRFDEINDPKGLCKDITNVGHWGNGDVEIKLSSLDQIEDVMFLVRQGFNKYSDDFD
ncbi:MAG: DUF262 and DUF1524 domain-containing protein [Nostoc sp.]|uniref:DUF262 and DUF1524 domain-containing protein n=1 Tax=Nostoc sp. TaxID=1180 RepID=UPI002FF4FCFC